MRFTEIDLFGVYVAPMSLMLVAAWVITIGAAPVRRPLWFVALRLAPSLFVFSVYMIVLSTMVLAIAAQGRDVRSNRMATKDVSVVLTHGAWADGSS